MKTLLTLTTAAFLAATFPALAGPTEKATGCATKPVQGGGNYTNFVDPNCFKSKGGAGMDPLFVSVVSSLVDPEDEDEGEDAAE